MSRGVGKGEVVGGGLGVERIKVDEVIVWGCKEVEMWVKGER